MGYYYTSSSGNTYIYNTSMNTFNESEMACRDSGGHLVSWLSGKEQGEVEGYYQEMGFMIPPFHSGYWMGARSTIATWPNFTWIDHSPGINASSRYRHWGVFMPGKVPEPNNLMEPPELCAACNYSTSYGNPKSWGWCDTNCEARMTFMCKMQQPLSATCHSETTGHDYILNTTYTDFWSANANCNSRGGYLVSYGERIEEQQEVENCFIDGGYLLPNFHKFYWMGLATGINNAKWPNFTWIDHAKVIYVGLYQHWGMLRPQNLYEPNNVRAPENCAGSNLTTGWFDAGGWADHHCSEKYVYICEIAPQAGYSSFTSSAGNEFKFFGSAMTQHDAEEACNMAGAHLASYDSLDEQAEVEDFYINNGWLLPTYHQNYWIGLQTNAWPAFVWDNGAPAPSNETYSHWGIGSDSIQEPNNTLGNENCVVANFSQTFDTPAAWGWADTQCDQRFSFMCRKALPGAYVYAPGQVSASTEDPFQFFLTRGAATVANQYTAPSGATYILNTTLSNYIAAQQACEDNGGHLVSYANLAEQADVERYFTDLGLFIPVWHK